MPDHNQEVPPGHEGENQPWREARHQPEPEGIEGHHAGRRVPEEKQRHERHDTGVGAVSRVEGDDAGGDRGDEGGLATGTSFGGPEPGHQGSSSTPGGGTGTTHAHGQGRATEGAFGEERAQSNANPLNDIRDAGISKNELGPSRHDDRTQGGDQ